MLIRCSASYRAVTEFKGTKTAPERAGGQREGRRKRERRRERRRRERRRERRGQEPPEQGVGGERVGPRSSNLKTKLPVRVWPHSSGSANQVSVETVEAVERACRVPGV
eukprot:1052421-Rhodomonas_salina.1